MYLSIYLCRNVGIHMYGGCMFMSYKGHIGSLCGVGASLHLRSHRPFSTSRCGRCGVGHLQNLGMCIFLLPFFRVRISSAGFWSFHIPPKHKHVFRNAFLLTDMEVERPWKTKRITVFQGAIDSTSMES